MERTTGGGSRFGLGLAAGIVLGLCSGGIVAGAVGYVLAKKSQAEARRGWNLSPVVVANADLKPGEKVEDDDFSQRAVPDSIVTASVIKPEASSYVRNARLLVPVPRGEPLRWTYFEVSKYKPGLGVEASRAACIEALEASHQLPAGVPTVDALRAQVVGAKP